MRARRTVRRIALVTSGTAVAAALVATAAVGEQWAQRFTAPESTAVAATTRQVEVDPPTSTYVCPRPARLPEGSDVGDDQFGAAPVETRTAAAAVVGGAAGDPVLARLDGSRGTGLTTGPDLDVLTREVSGTRVLLADPRAGSALRLAGALASSTAAGDLRGLAAASCRAPATEHWLVGGGSQVGRTAVLTVQNPSESPATVGLAVHGPNGPVSIGGRGAFTVAPGEQEVLRLDSLAPEQRRLAVRVSAAGARVTASWQTQGIDGLVPAGTDLLEPGAPPSRTVAFSGVVGRGEAPLEDQAAELWLLAPDDRSGTARVSVYGPQGRVTLRGADVVDLGAGAVTTVPLGGLDPGTYTVVVDADVPVVGAARFALPGEQPEDSVVDGTPYDLAWNAGQVLADEPAGAGQVALPAVAEEATVVLAAVPADRSEDADLDGTVAVRLRGVDTDGGVAGEQQVDVPVGGTVEVPAADVGAATAVFVDPATDGAGGAAARVLWSVRLTASDGTGTDGTLVATLDPTSAAETDGVEEVRRVDAP
ncbi:DUF5719 family protein [Isoptericola haloaureus]|uniref:DUF5719 family protein n=1 Tax=Isoptericola haloaureus TaxID=1542902 RepID=A0ABU7Z518_9MICO